ncbi:hypothetical protein [Bradyrhizobium erythrophlei]|uniref:Uncharacterized protein n=1 Tax=Bradyrhizobium erythrophlei TaxID=1437360 RepID=A0A1M5PNS5_9BRAD|nr:hypothetical protein [Bradyrhizobium erythrophlei]SHH03386.1 hypothetical protein SAMN05443248_3446 [Bradyrhizobium erythrophlei]
MPLEEAQILVTTPKGWKAPPRWPRGTIVQVKEDGRRIRYVPSLKLLAWLGGNGLVNIKFESDEHAETSQNV